MRHKSEAKLNEVRKIMFRNMIGSFVLMCVKKLSSSLSFSSNFHRELNSDRVSEENGNNK